MSKKIRWITETAVMLALLVCLQAVTKPMGQLVTGSCVNAVLAISALVGGLSCGLVVALCSPVLAFLLGIAPQILTVPAIMAGNGVYVLLLCLLVRELGGDIFRTAQLWSKEIENNADNVDSILDAAYEHPAFTDDKLLGMLLK